MIKSSKFRVILVVCILLLFAIGVASISREEISFSLLLETNDMHRYNGEILRVEGYILKLPFNQVYVNGEASILDERWILSDYQNYQESETINFDQLRHQKLTIFIVKDKVIFVQVNEGSTITIFNANTN